jgi:hypothetical protein
LLTKLLRRGSGRVCGPGGATGEGGERMKIVNIDAAIPAVSISKMG